jgi:hypothetical protein
MRRYGYIKICDLMLILNMQTCPSCQKGFGHNGFLKKVKNNFFWEYCVIKIKIFWTLFTGCIFFGTKNYPCAQEAMQMSFYSILLWS